MTWLLFSLSFSAILSKSSADDDKPLLAWKRRHIIERTLTSYINLKLYASISLWATTHHPISIIHLIYTVEIDIDIDTNINIVNSISSSSSSSNGRSMVWPFRGYQIKEHCLYRFDSKLLEHSLNLISLHAPPFMIYMYIYIYGCLWNIHCYCGKVCQHAEVFEPSGKQKVHTMFAYFLFTLINLEFILPFIEHSTNSHTCIHIHPSIHPHILSHHIGNNQVDQYTHFLSHIHKSLSVVRVLSAYGGSTKWSWCDISWRRFTFLQYTCMYTKTKITMNNERKTQRTKFCAFH